MSNLLKMVESIAVGNIETYRAGFAAGYMAGKREAARESPDSDFTNYDIAQEQRDWDEDHPDDDPENVEELPGRGPWA